MNTFTCLHGSGPFLRPTGLKECSYNDQMALPDDWGLYSSSGPSTERLEDAIPCSHKNLPSRGAKRRANLHVGVTSGPPQASAVSPLPQTKSPQWKQRVRFLAKIPQQAMQNTPPERQTRWKPTANPLEQRKERNGLTATGRLRSAQATEISMYACLTTKRKEGAKASIQSFHQPVSIQFRATASTT